MPALIVNSKPICWNCSTSLVHCNSDDNSLKVQKQSWQSSTTKLADRPIQLCIIAIRHDLGNPPTLQACWIASWTANWIWIRADGLISEIHLPTMSQPAAEQNRHRFYLGRRWVEVIANVRHGGAWLCPNPLCFPGGLWSPDLPAWIASNMSSEGHDTCTMNIVHACTVIILQASTLIMVHACTMIMEHVSCPIRLLFRESKNEGSGGQSKRVAGTRGPQLCPDKQTRLCLFNSLNIFK